MGALKSALPSMQKIKITAVSYLNTKPFIYGIYRSELAEHIDLQLDIPSECARKLAAGEVDLALAPVAVLPEVPQPRIVSDFCIGAVGPVRTVSLFSDVPLREIRRVFLDFHSKTSVTLVQVLCREFWKISPEFVPAPADFIERIGGDTAAVIIGDRTIGLDGRFRYNYDLAEAWLAWTGLPFVFAAWASNRPLSEEFLEKFNAALLAGIERVPELVQVLPTMPGFDVADYFKNCISYDLDEAKWAGMNLFLEKIAPTSTARLRRQEILARL